MELKKRIHYIPIGFAIFSMFFGAGNSLFPLLIGTNSGDKNLYAILGLSFTGILIPMVGLISMILYKGDYKEFFYRLGRIPGFLVICLIMILIGPFAGIPRCITIAFATLKPNLGSTPLAIFSLTTCIIIFVTTIRKRRLIDILGKILTPLLLFCLAIVIIKGFYAPKDMLPVVPTGGTLFFQGLKTGYQMMDLLASFFFATTVLACLRTSKDKDYDTSTPLLLKAIAISAILLAVIYIGFSFVAAFNNASFQNLPQESLLGAVGLKVLGSQIGVIMGLAVGLACLTTAITLVSIFSDFLYEQVLKKKLNYALCISTTVLIAFSVSNLGFSGICTMIEPILVVCYPSLILLAALNILHKLFDFKPLKRPVYALFFATLLFQILVK